MKKLLIVLCLFVSGCGIFVGDPYPSTYVDSYGCEVTVTEDYYTGWVCEETWCYDEYYQEWYLYDEYCY